MDDMQNGKRYESALAAIARAKNWPLFGSLKGLKFMDRIPNIESAFLEAAMQRDDESALQFFKWLMWSIQDWEFEYKHLLKPVEGGFEQFELPYNADVTAAEEVAKGLCTKRACELYPKLPAYETHKTWWLVTENEYERGEDKFPTLLQTRDAMLRDISTRCFETHSDAESDSLFSFFLTVGLNNEKEKKIYFDILYDATSKSVSLERLECHFEKAMREIARERKSSNGFVADVWREEEIARILGKAWVRNLVGIGRRWDLTKEGGKYEHRDGLEYLLSCMKVFAPLKRASDGAIDFLERFSRTIVAPMDVQTDGLIRVMREERGKLFPPQKVRGEISVNYRESMSELTVTVDISEYNIHPDAKKQELFFLAKTRAQEWENQKGKPRFHIHLEVMDRNTHASQRDIESCKDILWRYAEDI